VVCFLFIFAQRSATDHHHHHHHKIQNQKTPNAGLLNSKLSFHICSVYFLYCARRLQKCLPQELSSCSELIPATFRSAVPLELLAAKELGCFSTQATEPLEATD